MSDTTDPRWPEASSAFTAERPWCGWTIAFACESDSQTVASYGINERLKGLNILLTTADGFSRPVQILTTNAYIPAEPTERAHDVACRHGIEIIELDTANNYEPMNPFSR